ncbi:MAG: (d)CMP kinase [Candidatus Pacebacteria bacterium]|nr:(d)CMP kinase [Candidatus Cloacimonadota bacterium]MDD3386836.1 (d)CMP kinase [Candidatus Paceibacterota bacterium]
MIIAIDGPAASGKSTTAKLIAEKLNFIYIDTGAMYRAVALYALKNNLDISNHKNLIKIINSITIRFERINNENHIFLNNIDVTSEIRLPEITKLSSNIATKKIIRDKMVEIQRLLAINQKIIMDGRDIGTVVFPNANYKFFLTASIETRALRRLNEQLTKGIVSNLEDIKNDLIWRDKNDSEREFSPLIKAEDAIEVDTSNMTIEEQVKYILKVLQGDIA